MRGKKVRSIAILDSLAEVLIAEYAVAEGRGALEPNISKAQRAGVLSRA